MDPTFVGRTVELRRIAEVASASDGPVAVLVLGDPGSGKTRLVAEAVRRLQLAGALRIVGYEPEARVPLAAAAELLRAALPTLVLETEEPSRLEPMRIFEAAHRSLSALEPVAVTADDLQWADELSLALCHYLFRAAESTGQRLTLIAAARPSPQATSLGRSLAHIVAADRFAEIELGPLSHEESLELAHELAPELDEGAKRGLAELSRGSPFWLEALARSGGAAVDAGQLVTARLRGARADTSELLALIAVAGRPLALADAARLENWPPARVEHAAAELVARGVALQSSGGIRLAHDLIREAAVAEIPDERRRDIHRRLADWLEDVAGGELRHLREALDHRHSAGLPSLVLASRLARAKARTLLGEQGLALLIDIADAYTGDDVLELQREIASLAGELGKHGIALERWLKVADQAPDALGRASAFVRAARAALALEDIPAAHRSLARARDQNVDDRVFALQLETEEATVGLWSGDDRAAARALSREVSARARRLAQRAGGASALRARERRAYLDALRVEFDLAFQEDDVEAVLAAAEERVEAARGFDTEAFLGATIAGARALRRLGRLGEAELRLRGALDEAHRGVLPQLTIDAAYWLASVLEQQGRINEAEDVVSEAAELAERTGDEAFGRHRISRLQLKLGFHRGDWRSALAGLRDYGKEVSTHARIELYQDGATWLALVDGTAFAAESLSWLADARACAEKAACPRCATELRLAAAEVLARTGRAGDAAASLADWRGAQRHPQPRDLIMERWVEGLVAAARGQGSAAATLDATAALAKDGGFGLDALWAEIDVGRVLRSDDRDAAIRRLRGAAHAAATVGALTEQQVAEKLLRSLGVRTWRRQREGPELLTAREQQIARLISEGASNPEIAQQLFLSRKTVERHVSNVFKKVGVRNRAELAAKASEFKGEGAPR